ncbi:MAG TPA: glycosyl hydrolase [Bryobacteraceae bacterium]
MLTKASVLLAVVLFSFGLRADNWSAHFAGAPSRFGMGVHWWWFGPAVTKAEVERELDVMHRAGIASVLIYPIYPASADDAARGIRNLRYLSPEYLDVLGHAVRYARRLGIGVEMTIGTGWPSGGPWVTPGTAARKLAFGVAAPREGVPTGMRVKRAAIGGEGLVLDHLNERALSGYLDEVAAKLVAAAGQGNLRALHLDSLEDFGQNWTQDFLPAFEQRRGYNLEAHLGDLASDSGAMTADVRFDFWRTLSELAMDRFIRPLHRWCRTHGVALQAESYGEPPVDMASFAEVDDPAGESYDWKTFVASRWASSAAHQFGKRTTAAEAYTWLRFPRYVATLEDLKLGSDLHFVCGINRLIAHGYNYSPPQAGVPGWGYYASVMLNDNNTWWPYFPLLSAYVRRASYALQLGGPKVDVALYLPEDDVMAAKPAEGGLNLYMETKFHLSGGTPVAEFGLPAAYASETPLIKTIIASGFTFDGFDHSLIAAGAKAANGRIAAGDVSYRIAILPNLTGISLELLELLRDFCRSGGVLIATGRLPETAYGVVNREENRSRVRSIIAELFGASTPKQTQRRPVRRGISIFVSDDTRELASVLASLRPEVDFGKPDPGLALVHRGDDRRQLYFIANTSAERKVLAPVFRDGVGRPKLWDAMTGMIAEAPFFSPAPGGGVRVPLALERYGSVFIAFDGAPGAARGLRGAYPESLLYDASTHRWFERRFHRAESIAAGGPWVLDSGKDTWQLGQLGSWTSLDGFRYYSGTATYRTTVHIPETGPTGWWLELGDVSEIAEVSINGHSAGTLWKRPFSVDVTKCVKPGENAIAIQVTNLLINRVLGQPDPDYSSLEPLRFPLPQEKKRVPHPMPSGLIGPVRLVPYEPVAIP